ncbi:MAG TPA: ribonuclease III domain-containing protein [Candidatus Thermoplasmatota archaeon]|jgi:ribonuclease-3|nr:ribonuclease III domain-containing protein [Candidatus Thermoplasmatota archaeon]
MKPLESAQAELRYWFQTPEFLETSLRHSTSTNEPPHKGLEHNERLAFLGDAVLGLIVAQMLHERNRTATKGELTTKRQALVNNENLATIAGSKMNLDVWLALGEGEKTNEIGRNKRLATCFEALIGAVFLDGGYHCARRVFQPILEQHIPT